MTNTEELADPSTKLESFSEKVSDNFKIGKFRILAEEYATTWGLVNGAGRTFKLSNFDLQRALEEIIQNWDEWEKAHLNRNEENPDETLSEFARNYFSKGAHQVIANDQRRGFLHFLSAVAYSAKHDHVFDKTESRKPLSKDDYVAAHEIVCKMQKNSEAFAKSHTSKKSDTATDNQDSAIKGGENVIFYGAPGTGKSKTVDDKIDNNPVRTVFHPDLQNSDFFGSLKPQMNGGNVEYCFVPGPFMQAISRAYNNPKQTVYLVIEELNRAPAAAVFGDLFLLLDRDDYSGEGEYDVSFPSVESRKWFEGKIKTTAKRLRIPSNLTIYATMNSADQGVFPIDTAFRRRWRQEYLPLDYSAGPDGEIGYIDSSGNHNKIQWRDFVRILNNRLVSSTDLGIAEDRLLGQWFVKVKELDGDLIPEKVLLYLWDDLLRHGGRKMIFDNEIKTYGDLNALVVKKERVLSEDFLAELSESSISVGEPVPESSEDGTG